MEPVTCSSSSSSSEIVSEIDIAVTTKSEFDPHQFCEDVLTGPGFHYPGVVVKSVDDAVHGPFMCFTIPTNFSATWSIFGRNLDKFPLSRDELGTVASCIHSKPLANLLRVFFPNMKFEETTLLPRHPDLLYGSTVRCTLQGYVEEICKQVVPWAMTKAVSNFWDANKFCGILHVLLEIYFTRYGTTISTCSCKSWLCLQWFDSSTSAYCLCHRNKINVTPTTNLFVPLPLFHELCAPYTLRRLPLSIWAPTLEYTPSLVESPKDSDYIVIGLSNIRPIGFEEYLPWSPRLHEIMSGPYDGDDDGNVVIFPSNVATDTCILRITVKDTKYYRGLKRVLADHIVLSDHQEYLATYETIRLFPNIAGVVAIPRNLSSISSGPCLWHDFPTTTIRPTAGNMQYIFIGVHNVTTQFSTENLRWGKTLARYLYRRTKRKPQKGVDVFMPAHPDDTFVVRIAQCNPSFWVIVKHVEMCHISGPCETGDEIENLDHYKSFMKSFSNQRTNIRLRPRREINIMLTTIRTLFPGFSCRVKRRVATDVDILSPTLYERFINNKSR
jgi:hypothetical protein